MDHRVDAQVECEGSFYGGGFEPMHQLNIVLSSVPIRELIITDQLRVKFLNQIFYFIELLEGQMSKLATHRFSQLSLDLTAVR